MPTTLTYFDIPFYKGEAPRLLLSMGNIEFEDVRLSGEQFAEMKKAGKFPLSQVPVLNVDGREMTQGSAIIRYAAEKAGLWPRESWARAKSDEIMSLIEEMGPKVATSSLKDKSKEEIQEFRNTTLKIFFERLARLLGSKRFFMGEELSVADVYLRTFLHSLNTYSVIAIPTLPIDLVNDSAPIRALVDRVEQDARVQKYEAEKRKQIKLLYFDFGFWKAEVPRMLLSFGSIPFTDVRLTKESFKEMKANGKFPFGQVPVLEVNGKRLTQGLAIIRYAQRLAGLEPQDAFAMGQVEEVYSLVDEVSGPLYSKALGVPEKEQKEKRTDFCKNEMQVFLGRLAHLLGDNKYLVGDNLTAADLLVWKVLNWWRGGIIDHFPKTCVDAFPTLLKHSQVVESDGRFKAYLAKQKK